MCFQKDKLGLKKLPLRDGKEVTFYHIVSEGENENNRNLDLNRCARIKWSKAIIESNYVGLRVWKNKRKHKKNIIIWLTKADYVIIIRKNSNEKFLWTAYLIT